MTLSTSSPIAETRINEIMANKPASGVEALSLIHPDSTAILFAKDQTALVAVYPDFSALIAFYEDEGQVLSLAHSVGASKEAWEAFISYVEEILPDMGEALRYLFDSSTDTIH
jgi:hypothetical protein